MTIRHSESQGVPIPPRGFRGVFRTDIAARAVYSESAGIFRVMPCAVAVPFNAYDVVTLVGWAMANRTPLTPRGSGSSMGGGAVGPGVIVDLSMLQDAPVIDTNTRLVRVGPGVTRDRLELAANRFGLSMPVDPSSSAFATLGGMCSTNAAGTRTPRYGAMRRWVRGLDCVFADGRRAWLRRGENAPAIPAIDRFLNDVAPAVHATKIDVLRRRGVRKESSGYALADWIESGDLIDLIVGSEGTLAVVVDMELALAPIPVATTSLLAGFPDLEGAAGAAVRLASQGASAVELLDRTFLEIAASEGADLNLPAGLEAVLLIEAELSTPEDSERVARALSGWCEAGGASHIELGLTPEASERLWALRHAASPILNRLAPELQSMQLIEDGCVPNERFPEYIRGVRRALQKAGLKGVIFGHAGDAHAHVNALIDVTLPGWRDRALQLLREVSDLTRRLGGTISGEHGDGRLRTPLLGRVWSPEALVLFAATKRAFDPWGILNPGVKVTASTMPLTDEIKYDPLIEPLPPEARTALDLVVREKAWNLPRLGLLAGVVGSES